jgi:hypothetical protein
VPGSGKMQARPYLQAMFGHCWELPLRLALLPPPSITPATPSLRVQAHSGMEAGMPAEIDIAIQLGPARLQRAICALLPSPDRAGMMFVSRDP